MAVPAPVILPTPPFPTAGLIAWWDVTKTGFTLADSFSSPTISYIADLTGSGYDWAQPVKTLQPAQGTNGGAFFNGAGVLTMVRPSLINGLSACSLYVLLRPDLVTGGGSRSLIYIQQSPTNSFPPGTGAAGRIEYLLSSGSTGRKPYIGVSVNDQTLNVTSTSVNQSVGLANTGALSDTVTKVSVGWEMDLRASPAQCAFYHNGTLDTTQTWTPAEAFPWSLNNNNSTAIFMGANSASVPANFLYMEFVAGIMFKGIPTSAQRTAIQTYFASFP